MAHRHQKAIDACKNALSTFIKKNHKETFWFMQPVDHVALNLPQYPQIVKFPMDLGTIQRRLNSGSFAHFDEFASDVTLVFANALLFNPADHEVHQCALKLKAKFVDVYYKLISSNDIQNWFYPMVPPPRTAPPLQGSELSQCQDTLKMLMRMEDSLAFREPVPWFNEDLAQYPREVGRLMDLGTIHSWLGQNVYSTSAQFANDVRQVFRNAMKFNVETSVFYQQARTCEQAFEKQFAKVASSAGPTAISAGQTTVPIEHINALAAKVNKMSSNNLIRLVDEVKAKYAKILTQTAEDELELDLDALDKDSYEGLSQFVATL